MDCDRKGQLIAEITPNVAKYLLCLDSTHHNTCVHCICTAYYTLGIVNNIGDSTTMKSITTHGALLHDIGKTEIPNDLINKKTRLTEDEDKLIKAHPVLGAKILRKDREIKNEIVKIALFHHERLDGSGYPLGLHAVPLEVSIISVADVYEALTSKRCYKDAYSKEKTVSILIEEAKNNLLSVQLCELMREEIPLTETERQALYKEVIKICNAQSMTGYGNEYGKQNI